MSEFLRYVLWELRRYVFLAVLAGIGSLSVFGFVRFLYQRKYGRDKKFPWNRALLLLIFGGYLLIVLFVTNLRTPYMSREINLYLFRAWREALNNFSQHRWLNVLLNIAMFGPLGCLLPMMNRKFRKWYVTIPAGFGFSLFIELLQLIFARGIFDVDDLFCNTLGAAIGYFVVMAFMSAGNEKGKRCKPILGHTFLALLSLGAVGSVFLVYEIKEFGNLPQSPAYNVNTRGTEWILVCDLPQTSDSIPVYLTQTRTNEDCDAFAEGFRQIIPTEFDHVSYYQEAAYYMDHGSEAGAHFLHVNYLDQGFDYSAIYEDDPVWVDADRDTILKALQKYPLLIPETAEFEVLGDGWHSFIVNQLIDGTYLFDGVLRVRYAEDRSIWEIENSLLSYTYYGEVEVISPEEAFRKLTAGKFNDEGLFEHVNPTRVSVLTCTQEYRVDTKGFYQPVYVFDVESVDGSYRYQIVIPAMR